MKRLSTFPEPQEQPGVLPLPGKIVRVRSIGQLITRSGIVIVDNATHEDGPFAVFFNREVPWNLFALFPEGEWLGVTPTTENYQKCPRVVYFTRQDLVVMDSFSNEDLVCREFGDHWDLLFGPEFPFVANAHDCHIKMCTSGLLATCFTVMRVAGNAQLAYCCSSCHKAFHGKDFGIGPGFKSPLPGVTHAGGPRMTACHTERGWIGL